MLLTDCSTIKKDRSGRRIWRASGEVVARKYGESVRCRDEELYADSNVDQAQEMRHFKNSIVYGVHPQKSRSKPKYDSGIY